MFIIILVLIHMIFLASQKEVCTEWENGCQKFRSERVNLNEASTKPGDCKHILYRFAIIGIILADEYLKDIGTLVPTYMSCA